MPENHLDEYLKSFTDTTACELANALKIPDFLWAGFHQLSILFDTLSLILKKLYAGAGITSTSVTASTRHFASLAKERRPVSPRQHLSKKPVKPLGFYTPLIRCLLILRH
jgi:hypothetical protein